MSSQKKGAVDETLGQRKDMSRRSNISIELLFTIGEAGFGWLRLVSHRLGSALPTNLPQAENLALSAGVAHRDGSSRSDRRP